MFQARAVRWLTVSPLLFTLALALATAGLGRPAPARAAEVVLVVADRLDREDLWSAPGPHLAALRTQAAAGLVSTRILLSSLPESATAALGAGSFVSYEGSNRWRGGGTPEDAAAFRVDTGRDLPAGALYCRETERLHTYSNPGALIGALGTALHAAGKRTACIGNADVPGMPRRPVLSVLMDNQGEVDLGDVGPGVTARDPAAPGGMRANVAAMLRTFDRVASRADVVALDFGDASCLAALRQELAPVVYRRALAAALARLDVLVGGLQARLDPRRTLLIVISPSPREARTVREQALTPVFAVGRGLGPGLLASQTTRQPGVIANGDVPATIAALLGLPPLPGAAGQPLSSVPCRGAAARLADVDQATARVIHWRVSAITVWGVILLPALLVGPLWLMASGWVRAGRRERAAAGLRALQLTGLSLPAGMFLAACWVQSSFPAYVAALVGTSAGVALLAAGLARWWRALPAPVWLAAVTAALYLGDAALGGRIAWRTMIGYALPEGARYYGVGNEPMGMILGLALFALMSLLPRWGAPRVGRAAVGLGIGLALALGYSGVGANMGGAGAAAVGLPAAWVILRRRRGWAAAAVPAACMAGVVLALVGSELLRGPGSMSHVGRAIGSIHAGGLGWVADLVARKAWLNGMLIRFSGWSGLYFVAAPLLLAMALNPPAPARWPAHPGVRPLLAAGAVASAAAFLLNDTGITAGGLLMAFAAIGASYLAIADFRLLIADCPEPVPPAAAQEP